MHGSEAAGHSRQQPKQEQQQKASGIADRAATVRDEPIARRDRKSVRFRAFPGKTAF